jgi:hypothetical protein
MHYSRGLALLMAVAGLTTAARAQLTPPRPPEPKAIRSFVGGGLVITQPVGEFADNVGIGGGGVGTFSQSIDARGILSFRADFAYMVYGHEHKQIPFPTAPRVQLDLNTYNSILHGAVGPELRAVSGPIRPYVNGQVGFVYLFTESSLSGTDNGDSFASTPNYRFTHISWVGSYGVLIPLNTRAPVSIDLGAHYLFNGKARYLTPGDIHEDSSGNVSITPHHSDANLIMYRIGVRVGVS